MRLSTPYHQSPFAFRKMALKFCVRDWLYPPRRILLEAGLKPGMTVLDFGCGPGSFSLAAAEMVGTAGFVFAVDIQRQALISVQRSAAGRGLKNIAVLYTDALEGLRHGAVDMVLLYDVLHLLADGVDVLSAMHRLLKPAGVMSVSDHHMKEADIRSQIAGGGIFCFEGRSRTTMQFTRVEADRAAV